MLSLAGRLNFDDPNDLEAMSVVAGRHHGTAMASLILHGDLNVASQALSRRLYVHPVLCALDAGEPEVPQRNRLLIDVIYQAIRRMKGDDGGEATAAEVFLVNLSLGDLRRPFSGPISPWARLLDYLAEHYGILFLVSAGNIQEPLQISSFTKWIPFEEADSQDRGRAVLLALSEQKARRTLLSPAEALNPITVGAMHDDAIANNRRGAFAVDPYPTKENELPNISSAMGLGYRKAVKPDIYFPGGREYLRKFTDRTHLIVSRVKGRSGLKAASPDKSRQINSTQLIMGTSAATALATRSAHLIFDALIDQNNRLMSADVEPEFRGVLVKALLVHRAKWGSYAEFLDQNYDPHGQGKHIERRDNIARLLGFGFPKVREALSCAPNRATLVGYGTISASEDNIHKIPLPLSLEKVTELRALTVTVAWFSPVNFRHQAYRQVKLEVIPERKLKKAAGVERLSREQPASISIQRGTLLHTRYAGKYAVAFLDSGHVVLRIHRQDTAGQLDQSIRYGIAVTIEAGENVPVYEEVRAYLAAARVVQPST